MEHWEADVLGQRLGHAVKDSLKDSRSAFKIRYQYCQDGRMWVFCHL